MKIHNLQRIDMYLHIFIIMISKVINHKFWRTKGPRKSESQTLYLNYEFFSLRFYIQNSPLFCR